MPSLFQYRVIQYDPTTGTSQGPVAYPIELNASAPLNDIGALDGTFGLSSGVLQAPTELAVEVSKDGGQTWSEPPNMRYAVIKDEGSALQNVNYPKLTAPGMAWQLGKAVIHATAGQPLDSDGRRAWTAITPGALIRTLVQEAQARSVISWLDMSSFSSTTDSNGAPWPTTLTTSHEIGVSYDSVLMALSDAGLVDWHFQGRSLRVYVVDTFLNPGDSGAVLVDGRDFTETSRTNTYELVASRNLIRGDNGVSLIATDATADKPWGEWEVYTSASGTDTPSLNLLASSSFARSSKKQTERTYSVAPNADASTYKPWVDYKVGAKLTTVIKNAVTTNLRVRQLTLVGKGAQSTVTVVLGDRLLEDQVRASRKLSNASGGLSASGTGSTPIPPDSSGGTDTTTPNPPTGLSITSLAILFNTNVYADATMTWTAPTTNTDSTILDDLDYYEIQVGRGLSPTAWAGAGISHTNSAVVVQLQPNTDYGFRVRAVDSSGHQSSWLTGSHHTANDAVAPNTPSTPVVAPYLGILMVTWDGKDSTAGAMPTDFVRLEVHMSTSSATFTPSAATLVGDIIDPQGGRLPIGNVTYGTTYFVRTIAVDAVGNKSTPSTGASGVPARVTSLDIQDLTIATTDLGDNAVSSAKIVDAAITSAKIGNLQVLNAAIANLAVDDAKIANLSVGKLTTGILSADITVSARIKTANTGARVELNSNGIQAFNSTGGQTVDIAAATGSVTITGKLQTGFTGQRIVIDPSGPQPTFYYYPSSGTNVAFINSPTGSTASVATLAFNSGNWTSPYGPTTVTSRIWAHDTGIYNTIIDNTQTQYGGQMFVGGNQVTLSTLDGIDTAQLTVQKTIINASVNAGNAAVVDGWLRLDNVQAKIQFGDSTVGGGYTYVTSTIAQVGGYSASGIEFLLQMALGSGQWFMRGYLADYNAANGFDLYFTGSVLDNTSHTSISFSYGATMQKAMNPLVTLVLSGATVPAYKVQSFSSTGFTVLKSVATAGNYILYCYRCAS